MSRYAIQGCISRELWSYHGAILVHENREDLEFMINPASGRVVRVSDGDLGQPTMRFRDHPGMKTAFMATGREDFV